MLRRAGYADVTVFERGERVGGVWHHNTYPGAACDIPSHLYEFSFAPNPRWSRRFAPRPEIQAYLEELARPLDVRTSTEVRSARFDGGRWTLETSAGSLQRRRADHRVRPALDPERAGAARARRLRRPRVPHRALAPRRRARRPARGGHRDGLQRDPGRAGDRRHGRAGRRLPALAGLDDPEDRLRLLRAGQARVRALPGAAAARPRLGLGLPRVRHARHDPPPPAARRAEGGRRAARSGARSPTRRCAARSRRATSSAASGSCSPTTGIRRSTRDDVELVSDAHRDASRRAASAPAAASAPPTCSCSPPASSRTRSSRRWRSKARDGTLAEAWGDVPRAYLGVTVPDFPNLFLLYGPNTNGGTGSVVATIESSMAPRAGRAGRAAPRRRLARSRSAARPPTPSTPSCARPCAHRLALGLHELVRRRARQRPEPVAVVVVGLPPPHRPPGPGGLHGLLERLAARVARVEVVPEADVVLAVDPAQVDLARRRAPTGSRSARCRGRAGRSRGRRRRRCRSGARRTPRPRPCRAGRRRWSASRRPGPGGPRCRSAARGRRAARRACDAPRGAPRGPPRA